MILDILQPSKYHDFQIRLSISQHWSTSECQGVLQASLTTAAYDEPQGNEHHCPGIKWLPEFWLVYQQPFK